MALDVRLLDMLVRARELRERGVAVTAEELCGDCTELLPDLRRLPEGTEAIEQLLHVRACSPTVGISAASLRSGHPRRP
jgi:hypothetical protein